MYKHVLVPVSFDEERDAAGALEVAGALSADDGKITLIHVIEELPGYALSYVREDVRASARADIQKDLDAMAGRFPNAQALVVEGHSARTILDHVNAEDVDCVVIASHKPGLQDVFLGSTAARVVRHAPCAVHVVR